MRGSEFFGGPVVVVVIGSSAEISPLVARRLPAVYITRHAGE